MCSKVWIIFIGIVTISLHSVVLYIGLFLPCNKCDFAVLKLAVVALPSHIKLHWIVLHILIFISTSRMSNITIKLKPSVKLPMYISNRISWCMLLKELVFND